MSILPHKAKALLQLFCLQPIIFGWRQNSFSGAFASWGKIKIHYFRWADQDWIGLMIFKNFADQDWIGFNFIGSGLDSDWKISQSAHLCWVLTFLWYIHYVICKMFVSVDLKLSTLLASLFCFYFVLNSCFVLHLYCWIWQWSNIGLIKWLLWPSFAQPVLFVLSFVDWNVFYCCVLKANTTWLDKELQCYYSLQSGLPFAIELGSLWDLELQRNLKFLSFK